MEKCKKEIAKAVVAILAAVLMFFAPIGQLVSVANTIEDVKISSLDVEQFYFKMFSKILKQNINPIVITAIVTTTTVPTTTIVTTITNTTEMTEEREQIFVFKPETHYIHTKDCHWVKDGLIEEITNTTDIEARLCDECCPDIKIVNFYEEPIQEYEEEEYNEEKYSEESYEETDDINYSKQGNYNLSDWDYTLLCRIVSSEYGSDWVPVEEKAKIVASIMNRVYNSNGSKTILDVLYEACVPWGFDPYKDYYMDDSIYAAVDYYFNSGAFNDWTCTSWSGDGTWNYFY